MKVGEGVGEGLGEADVAVPHPMRLQRKMRLNVIAMLFLVACVNTDIFSSFVAQCKQVG